MVHHQVLIAWCVLQELHVLVLLMPIMLLLIVHQDIFVIQQVIHLAVKVCTVQQEL